MSNGQIPKSAKNYWATICITHDKIFFFNNNRAPLSVNGWSSSLVWKFVICLQWRKMYVYLLWERVQGMWILISLMKLFIVPHRSVVLMVCYFVFFQRAAKMEYTKNSQKLGHSLSDRPRLQRILTHITKLTCIFLCGSDKAKTLKVTS